MPAAVPSAVNEVYASVVRVTTSSGSSSASADAFVNSASRRSAWIEIERHCARRMRIGERVSSAGREGEQGLAGVRLTFDFPTPESPSTSSHSSTNVSCISFLFWRYRAVPATRGTCCW